jgi:plastocyanin
MTIRRLPVGAAACLLAVSTFLAAPRSSDAVTLPKNVLIVNGAPEVCTSLFCYHPANLTVTVGTNVAWTNTSAAPHTVTGVSGGPSSGTLLPGTRYTFKFTSPGTFTYFCTIHGFAVMHGTVTVMG